MAYSLINHTAAHSLDGGISALAGPVDTSGANLLVAGISTYAGATTPSILDSFGNTWTFINAPSGGVQVYLFYSYAPTVGAVHTFLAHAGGVPIYPGICVLAFSGAAASPLDSYNGNGGYGTYGATGNVTPSEDNELLVTFASRNNNSDGVVTPSGFTLGDSFTASGLWYGGASAYKVQTSAFTENVVWNYSTATDYIAVGAATFKAAAAAGGPLFLAPNLSLASGGPFFRNPLT